MALPVRFSKDDFLMGKAIKPGSYHFLVKGIVTKPAKSDGSTVYNIQLKCVEKGDYFGIPVTDFMSEKALGMSAIRFIRAANNGVDPKPDENYDLDNARGKVLKAHISNGLYQGRITNTVDDYDTPDPGFQLEE